MNREEHDSYGGGLGEKREPGVEMRRSATARTPSDFNRGVQNATEAGIAENRRVLAEMEEVREVQRKELAEVVAGEFRDIFPSLTAQPLRRNEDAFDQVLSRLRAAVQEQRRELEDLRDALAHERSRRVAVDPQQEKELRSLREQIADADEMIRRLQEARRAEAQVIADWKKDVLLWLKHSQSHPSPEPYEPPVVGRRSSFQAPPPYSRPVPPPHYVEEDEYYYDYEAPAPEPYLARARTRRPGRRGSGYGIPPNAKAREDHLLDILEQGERVYSRIMETSQLIRRRLSHGA